MGSIDIGPYYLGSGKMATSASATKRDLRKVLLGARRQGALLVIGSAGSAGAAPHLDQTLALIREIAHEESLSFRMGVLSGDMDRDVLRASIAAGDVVSIDGMPDLTVQDVDEAAHIVAQMGMASFQRALAEDIDVLVAGRACDTSIYAALPVMLGFPAGLSIHMAKIIECASLCCLPGGRDSMLAILDDEGFELESMASHRRATPASVAAHSLYEQSDPFTIIEPQGYVDLREARYEALDERRTRVSGARWVPVEQESVKLEGAQLLGERAVLLCAASDPYFIESHEDILVGAAQIVESLVCEDIPKDYTLAWRTYGVNGVRPAPAGAPPPHEVFLLIECLAPTAERSAEVVRTMKQYLLHYGYPGRKSTGGNLAFAFTPPEISVGPAYRFNVYHIMKTVSAADHFPLSIESL